MLLLDRLLRMNNRAVQDVSSRDAFTLLSSSPILTQPYSYDCCGRRDSGPYLRRNSLLLLFVCARQEVFVS